MPYAVLEKEMEGLDEAQQNAVVMFVRFLVSQKSMSVPVAVQKPKTRGNRRERKRAGMAHEVANEKLMELAGSWVSDPEAEKVFDEMRIIDEEMWK